MEPLLKSGNCQNLNLHGQRMHFSTGCSTWDIFTAASSNLLSQDRLASTRFCSISRLLMKYSARLKTPSSWVMLCLFAQYWMLDCQSIRAFSQMIKTVHTSHWRISPNILHPKRMLMANGLSFLPQKTQSTSSWDLVTWFHSKTTSNSYSRQLPRLESKRLNWLQIEMLSDQLKEKYSSTRVNNCQSCNIISLSTITSSLEANHLRSGW